MIDFVQSLGASVIALLRMIGSMAIFIALSLRWGLVPPFYGKQILRQLIDIGYIKHPVLIKLVIKTNIISNIER